MTRDSLSFLMLFLLLSHNPISFYVLQMTNVFVYVQTFTPDS